MMIKQNIYLNLNYQIYEKNDYNVQHGVIKKEEEEENIIISN